MNERVFSKVKKHCRWDTYVIGVENMQKHSFPGSVIFSKDSEWKMSCVMPKLSGIIIEAG